jgi:hypothetical protein
MHVFVLTRVFKMHVFVWENNGPLKVLLSQSQSAISPEVMLAILSHVVMHCLDFLVFLALCPVSWQKIIQTFKSKIYYSKSCEQERTV